MSALHQAAFNGNVQMMHVLLDNGAAVDLQDSRGLRPIHVASFQGHFEAVHLLLKWSSCVNSAAMGSLAPLHLACQAGHYDVVKLLLCNNADPMLRADDGRSAFDVASEFGRFSIVQLLMSLKSVTGVLFEDLEFYPQSPQQRRQAAQSPNLSPSPAAAPPPQSSCRSGLSPPSCLHLAAKNGHVDVLRLLLSHPGVNINRVTDQGTCLHMAAFYGHVEATKLLLEQGIDPALTNAHGRTAKEVITRDTPHARELHQILFERMSAVGAVATRDFCNLADPRSIAFRCGEHVTVLERSCPDVWKGFVTREGLSRAGYFPSAAVRLLQQQQQPSHHLPDGLVACSVPQPPQQQHHHHQHPDLAGGVSPSSVDAACGGNRNSAASLDSGRSSAHTATSSDTRSIFAAASSSPAAASATAQSPSAASANAATSACCAASSPLSPAAAAAAINSSTDSGLGPHRQSIVSTCSSTGSLGSSLPDDSSSVSSGENQHSQLHHQLPEDWPRMTPGEQLSAFLWGCQLSACHRCLAEAGYDLPTLIRCTPEDLNAAGLTNPRDRKRLRQELGRLGLALQAAGLPDPLEEAAAASARQRHLDDVSEFCARLGLPEAAAASLRRAGLATVRDLAQMAWEDLEEVGISKLGHQKKLMLAIDRVRRPRCRPSCPDPGAPDGGPDAHSSSSSSSSAGCATLRRQQARQTVSCGTCTTTDLIIVQPPDAACCPAAAEETPTHTYAPAPATAHSRSCSDSGAAGCLAGAPDSQPPTPVRSPAAVVRPVAKVPGRPIPVPVPEVPPPQSAEKSAAAAAAQSRVPPPPPKRVTSVRRCSADTTPCASPTPPARDSPRRLPSAVAPYENAAALVETAAARLAAAASSVPAIPFANEDCGTIRHKPHAAIVAAAGGMAAASPQFQRRQPQQHQQLLPASPAFARRVAHAGSSTGSPLPTPRCVPAAAASALLSPAHSAAAAAATTRRVLQPPTPRDDDSVTNLDDICGMLSDLQCILDRELREHQPRIEG